MKKIAFYETQFCHKLSYLKNKF